MGSQDNWRDCQGDYNAAMDIYDSKLHDRCMKKGGITDILDSTSLLYRLQMEGVNVESRWDDMYEVCRPHIGDHVMAFQDVHFLMAYLGAKQESTVQTFMDSVKSFINSDLKTHNQATTAKVGLPLCQAVIAYDNNDFATATDLLYPLKYDLLSLGRSNAQRDIFNQLLIHSAMKSPKKEHENLARSLILERQAWNEGSPLTERLMAKLLSLHVD